MTRTPWVIGVVLGFVLSGAARAAELKPRPGETLRIEGSARIAAGEYLLPPCGADGRQGVVRVEKQKGIVLDLDGVVLRGAPAGADLDRNAGWGIVLVDCQDVRIRGGRLGGFKGCLVAENCEGLVLDGIEFQGWYGARLLSNVAYEDLSDWLYAHHDDAGEWITNYGGAVSLTGCRRIEVKGCRGRKGQNGLLLTRCEGGEIYDCDFSFLSGWGLGMYRSSKLLVDHCLFDYCVRGYSDGVYWRGQDSAGILMFERCSDNVFVENSATHGGDGLFLFAGLDIVDEGNAWKRGEQEPGGCDRNVWYRNDFSYAVANAIEATFSRDNWAIGNALNGSHQHGVWGGYSSRMVVLGNVIERTLGGGVSIEHGQENAIVENQIEANQIGVELWWSENKALDEGPFGQHFDTKSRDSWVYGNAFGRNAKDLVVRKTTGLWAGGNRFDGSGEMRMTRTKVSGGEATAWMTGRDGKSASGEVEDVTVAAWAGKEPEWVKRARAWKTPALRGTQRVFAKDRGERQGLDTIVMGEWGPWDFRAGEPRPKPRLPGGLLKDARWKASWFSWKGGPDPRERLEEYRRLEQKPLASKEVGNWVDPWGGEKDVREKVGTERFGMRGAASVEVKEQGRYRFVVVSDDGVRLMVDGAKALENWTWHAPTRDEGVVELAPGRHELEVEYFQIDGAWALSVEMTKVE